MTNAVSLLFPRLDKDRSDAAGISCHPRYRHHPKAMESDGKLLVLRNEPLLDNCRADSVSSSLSNSLSSAASAEKELNNAMAYQSQNEPTDAPSNKEHDDLTNNNQRDGRFQSADAFSKKEDYSSSCLYSESLAAAAAAVAAAAAASVKQEDATNQGGYVKLEPEQQQSDVQHLYHSALYGESRSCWTGSYGSGSGGQQGYVDFARPELDHYSALQKLSCSFPSDCSTATTRSQQPCIQQSTNGSSSSYRGMMNPAAAAAAAVAAMSTPLYAMSSLGYSDWSSSTPTTSTTTTTSSTSASNGSRTSSNSSAPISKGIDYF